MNEFQLEKTCAIASDLGSLQSLQTIGYQQAHEHLVGYALFTGDCLEFL